MNPTLRVLVRWIHIILSVPIIGYIYSPFDAIPGYAPLVRFIYLPVMLATGLWMWKGHRVLRLFTKRPALARVEIRIL